MELHTIAMILYLLTSFAIIGLILMQQGKGAEAGASFGAGSSATVFGSAGGGNFFSRLTAILATVFFVLAFGLTLLAKQSVGVSDIPAAIEQNVEQVEESDIPTLDTAPAESADDVPAMDASDVPAEDVPAADVPAAEDAPVEETER
ncbi:preprotein translocase subunit SecG [Halioxenophilus aromaticivorans]|uniref:Protein-export membrane protein SecG n=1 Tax=Halioxenophilus aromaticivorans TaxID=1306992 RepID=A0AAV3U968_9ALTE